MRWPRARAARSSSSTAAGTWSNSSVGTTTTVPAVRTAASPFGTSIRRPASSRTDGVAAHTVSWYQGTPNSSA